MEDLSEYLNDPQLSEYLNDEENEDPKPLQPHSSKKKLSFQALMREVVMCHMREIEGTKDKYKKGIDVLVKRYKSVKDEKAKLKSKVEYWSEESKKLQFENSKLLSFLKNGLCGKCEKQMHAVCGNYDFYKQSTNLQTNKDVKKDHRTSKSDTSLEDCDISLNKSIHDGHMTSVGHVSGDDHVISSDNDRGTDETSPATESKNRKLKLNRRSSRCRYAATSVRLRKSPNKSKADLPMLKKSSKRDLGNNQSPTKATSSESPTHKSPMKSNIQKGEKTLSKRVSKSFDLETRTSDEDIVLESPKLKRLKISDEKGHVSPRLLKLNLTKEANRVFKRSNKIMKYKGKNNKPKAADSPSLFDEGHELIIEDDVIAASPVKPRTRSSAKEFNVSNRDTAAKDDRNPHSLHSASVQSTPSPSMLSGNPPQFNINVNERNINSTSPKLKLRDSSRKDTAIEIDPDNCDSPSSKQKKLVQTKITHEMFMPTKTYLPTIQEFNNGVLTPSKSKEDEDIQEAIKKSLEENAKTESLKSYSDGGLNSCMPNENNDLESISAFTIPPVTSTPFQKDYCSEEAFKKPQIPRKVPTTPKRKEAIDSTDSSPRRSPRLNKHRKSCNPHDDLEIFETCPGDVTTVSSPISKQSRHSKSKRSLELESLPSRDVSVTVQSKGNKSIDPHVHLSQYETVPDDNDHDLVSLRCIRSHDHKLPKSPTEESLNSLDSDSLDLTCQSVVFGPPKTKNSKCTNPENVSKPNSPTDSPENVIHVPETMDVDLDLDLDDVMVDDTNTSPQRVAENKESSNGAMSVNVLGVNNSFDVVPKDQGPNYAYADVVRKRGEREQLKSYTCKECEAYFNADGEGGDNLKFCRHKARYVPPSTPEHFWDVTLPDTQVAQERGYMNITQGKPSKFRRKRKLNKLFKSKDELGSDFDDDDDEIN